MFDEDLLPCPFCGAGAEWEFTPWDEETQTGDDGTGWIECTVCHVQMWGDSRDAGAEQWNRRVEKGG